MYQIITPLVSLFLIVYVWNLVPKQKKTIWEASLWTIFWLAVAAVAVFPNAIDYLTKITGIKNRENAVFISAIGVMFFVIFYLIMRLEEIERKQTKLIRSLALKDIEAGKK